MTTTRKNTLLHCGILTGILGAVVLLIFLVHPGCVYGAQTDWSNQHFAIPEYFRTRFYATGNLFPNFAMQLGSGQNIFNFAYYGLYSPVILLSFAFPWLSMATYLQISNILLTLSVHFSAISGCGNGLFPICPFLWQCSTCWRHRSSSTVITTSCS